MSSKTSHIRDTVICRCEEITEQEIRGAIKEFDLSFVDDVKRLTRAGMGLCQGRVCYRLVERILIEEKRLRRNELLPPSRRPPTRPISIQTLAGWEESGA